MRSIMTRTLLATQLLIVPSLLQADGPPPAHQHTPESQLVDHYEDGLFAGGYADKKGSSIAVKLGKYDTKGPFGETFLKAEYQKVERGHLGIWHKPDRDWTKSHQDWSAATELTFHAKVTQKTRLNFVFTSNHKKFTASTDLTPGDWKKVSIPTHTWKGKTSEMGIIKGFDIQFVVPTGKGIICIDDIRITGGKKNELAPETKPKKTYKATPKLPDPIDMVWPQEAVTSERRELYVSPLGQNSADGLSPKTALKTLQRASDLSEPGDLILVGSGTYEIDKGGALLTITKSGEPRRPITYQPAPGADVILKSNGAWEIIKIMGARHIEIAGFRLIGNAKNVTAEEAKKQMSNLGNAPTCGNAIGIDSHRETKQIPAYITIRNCVVSDFPGGGIFANHADYLTFEHNTVYGCAIWSPYGNSGISIYQMTPIDNSTRHKNFIRNNVCFDNYQNIPFYYSNKNDPSKRKVTDGNGIIIDDLQNTQGWGKSCGYPYTGRTLVSNNIVFNNGGSGIHSFKSCRVDIVHNYAYNNNQHPTLRDGQIFSNSSFDMSIHNNIMVAPEGKPATSSYKNKFLQQSHNLYANTNDSEATFPPELGHYIKDSCDIQLINWKEGSREISIKSDTPLRQAGKPFYGITKDFFGNEIDIHRPDIGPFALSK